MLAILGLSAVFTSIVSGIIGMGGGVLLLSIMSFFLPYQLLIPIHGIVQLVSNSSRSFYLKSHINWGFFLPFLAGAPIGFVIAYFLIKSITNEHYFYLFLGLFILATLLKPKKLPEIRLKTKGWLFLGIASGIQGSLVGATGPLIAPFFIRSDLKKEEIVATKALQQIVTHFLKIPLFLSLNFNYIDHSLLIVIMSIAAIGGTLIGVKILGKTNEALFRKLFKIILGISSLRLLYKFGSMYE